MDLSAVHPLQSFGLAVTGSSGDRFTARVILKATCASRREALWALDSGRIVGFDARFMAPA